MAYLIRKGEGSAQDRQWPLGAEVLTVGRGDDVSVRVDDPKVSRRHFSIELRGSRYILTDLGSGNGTWVNDQRVQSADLQSGDCIAAGDTVFVFQSGFDSLIMDATRPLREARKGPRASASDTRE